MMPAITGHAAGGLVGRRGDQAAQLVPVEGVALARAAAGREPVDARLDQKADLRPDRGFVELARGIEGRRHRRDDPGQRLAHDQPPRASWRPQDRRRGWYWSKSSGVEALALGAPVAVGHGRAVAVREAGESAFAHDLDGARASGVTRCPRRTPAAGGEPAAGGAPVSDPVEGGSAVRVGRDQEDGREQLAQIGQALGLELKPFGQALYRQPVGALQPFGRGPAALGERTEIGARGRVVDLELVALRRTGAAGWVGVISRIQRQLSAQTLKASSNSRLA